MQNNLVETLIGAAVIAVAAAFLWFGAQIVETEAGGGYLLTARFERADGIGVGTDVRLSGIKVGTVTNVTLDPKTYLAVIELSVAQGIEVPTDSTLKAGMEGLLGGAYLVIVPGGDDTLLTAGAEFRNTQSPIDLVGLVGQAVFQSGAGGGDPAREAP